MLVLKFIFSFFLFLITFSTIVYGDTVQKRPLLPLQPAQVCYLPQEWDINCTVLGQSYQADSRAHLLTPEDLNTTTLDFFDPDQVSNDDNGTNWFYYRDFLTGMDDVYNIGTEAVILLASGIDYGLYNMVGGDDENESLQSMETVGTNKTVENVAIAEQRSNEPIREYVKSNENNTSLPKQLKKRYNEKGATTYWMSRWFDIDAKNSQFLNLSDNSYVRLRGGYIYNYRGTSEFTHSISARLKIPRTKDKLNLIIGDETRQSEDLNFKGTDRETDNNSVALGFNNIFGLFKTVKSSFRAGFSGVTNPYAKWRLQYGVLAGSWFINAEQILRYSRKSKFEEWTNLTFMRRTSSTNLFSLLFQRSTQDDLPGMQYLIQPAHMHALENGSLTVFAGMYGRTKTLGNGDLGYEAKRGIYAYSIGVGLRKQTSKKYIVYNLQPAISFQDVYNYKPNYIFTASLEFYFGLRD